MVNQQLQPEHPNFFEAGSPYLQHPLLTPARTQLEVDFVITQLGLPAGARLLDVGCGFGRHSIELAHRGHAVTGIDPSPAMVQAAQAQAADDGVAVEFHITTGEAFVSEQPYAAAICLFTTLGQIADGRDNSGLLGAVYNALEPGGGLIVETPQREVAIQALKSHERFGAGDRYTDVTRSFDSTSSSVSERFEVVNGDAVRTFLLRYRLYSRSELERLLAIHGFAVSARFADYEGAPLRSSSPTLIVIAGR